MQITLTPPAKDELIKLSNTFALSITEGCCGKSFALDQNPLKKTVKVIEIDGIQFYVDDETESLAPEVAIDFPGPIDGFMITNLKAIGGCACGRSFYVD